MQRNVGVIKHLQEGALFGAGLGNAVVEGGIPGDRAKQGVKRGVKPDAVGGVGRGLTVGLTHEIE